MSHNNEAVMRRFIAEVINGRDLAVTDEVLHPDYVYRSHDTELRGPGAFREFIGSYHAAFPDFRMVVDEMVAAGHTTVTFFTLTGTQEGEIMGIPPTGNQIHAHGVVRSRFLDGRIVDEWEVVDQLSILAQLGVISLPE